MFLKLTMPLENIIKIDFIAKTMNLKLLLTGIKKLNKDANLNLIKRAYIFAESAHDGQFRSSGDNYIKHPLNVALILSSIGMDDETICAGLLHDVLEDTKVTYEQLLKELGLNIANLVDGVTKISNLKYSTKEETDIENLRKMLLATSKDIRVIIIKLADRLHNMRTLDSLSKEKQQKIAKETLEVYSPLAYRLGMIKIKSELEDLSFKYLNPKEYVKILHNIQTTRKQREKMLDELKSQLEQELINHKIDSRLQYRVKNIYSIYKKIHERDTPLEDMQDLVALRVITKNVKECYEVLGIVHNLWKPMENRVRDYIATPRSNMYQSIHTNVITQHGFIIEVQIRTEDMHKISESGIAAHFKYKGMESDERFDRRIEWLKQVLSNDQKNNDLLDTLKIELFGEEIFVFTPKGKVIGLPVKSSPIDFAYKLHSDIGNHCTGSKINGNFVPLNIELKNGDIIEILTQKNQKPNREWLKFVKTSDAREKIKKYIRQFEKIPVQSTEKKVESITKYKSILEIKNNKNVIIKFSNCCNPIPKDKLVAVINENNIATIHKIDCKSIKVKRGKIVEANWKEAFESSIKINIISEDRIGLFSDLIKIISNSGINVESAKANVVDKERAECTFELKPDTLEKLGIMIVKLENVYGVKKVSIK